MQNMPLSANVRDDSVPGLIRAHEEERLTSTGSADVSSDVRQARLANTLRHLARL